MLYLRLKCEPKIKKKKEIPTLGMWEAGENTIYCPILDRGVLGQEREWEKRWNSGRKVNRAFNKSGLSNLGCSYKIYVICVWKRSFSFSFVNIVERLVAGQ